MDWVSGQREWIGNGEIGVRIQHLTRKKSYQVVMDWIKGRRFGMGELIRWLISDRL